MHMVKCWTLEGKIWEYKATLCILLQLRTHKFYSTLQFHGEKTDQQKIHNGGIWIMDFFLYPIGVILRTMMAFRFFHKIFIECIFFFLTLLKTKFPNACTATDAITHHYNNYTIQFSKNSRIWPLFFGDKCNFYLKPVNMRTLCKYTYHQVFNRPVCKWSHLRATGIMTWGCSTAKILCQCLKNTAKNWLLIFLIKMRIANGDIKGCHEKKRNTFENSNRRKDCWRTNICFTCDQQKSSYFKLHWQNHQVLAFHS